MFLWNTRNLYNYMAQLKKTRADSFTSLTATNSITSQLSEKMNSSGKYLALIRMKEAI
jgi:hypothetical protein